MTTLDIVLLLCFIPGIVRGISKGFLEQVLALVGIVLSVWAAFKFSALLCTWLEPRLGLSGTVLNVVAFALILVAVSLAVLLLAKLLTKVIQMATLGWVNRLLGLLFALVVNALVIGLVIILFDTLNQRFGMVQAETLDASLVYRTLRDISYFVFPYLKDLIAQTPTTTV